ncbi:MAG: glycosyltransferase family 2 protein [Calditrichales bacterium]|nr:MAG: glycosyltransferase family 2 protein [Calditrichales bacterium]
MSTHLKFTISVVIPTYNRCGLLKRAIHSVLDQTRLPDEIILVDDGSTDGTGPFITANFPGVRYFYQENQGVSSARNKGIEIARGNWIAFLDADDQWLPSKLQDQVDALSINTDARFCHTDEIWIRNGRRVNPMQKHQKFGGDIFEKCLPYCIISPSTTLIHQSLFEQYGQFDPHLPVCEDYDLWLRICAFEPVCFIPEPTVRKYGGHDDQLSHQYWGMDRYRMIALEKIINLPDIAADKRRQAIEMLLKKIAIYLEGAGKRGKTDEVKKYEMIRAQYQLQEEN